MYTMFEFEIAVAQGRVDVAEFIYNDLRRTVVDFGGLVTSYSNIDKIFIVLACEESEKSRMSFYICQVIADAISTFYKLEFIDQNLMLPIQRDINYKAFKKALIAFDKETDKYIIAHNLRVEKSLFVDSFYQFKLANLRKKWMEIIKLANDNASYLLCSDTFIDLLKFLIDNIEISYGLVNVVKDKDHEEYRLCDEHFNELKTEQTLSGLTQQDLQDKDVCLVVSLIALSPKKINVYCNPYENSPILTLISQIFDSRVSILSKVENK